MSGRCIVSCSFSEGQDDRYRRYGNRLEQSLQDHGYRGAFHIWRDSFPPGSPTHRNHHYAFKVYAVKWAREQGYDQVMWLDSCCYAVADVEPIWRTIETQGHYIITGGDILGEWISDQALAYFGVSREESMKMLLTGGCVVGLNFAHPDPAPRIFYDTWLELAERTQLFISAHSKYAPDKMKSLLVSDANENMIVSDDPRVKGHRSDEACFALLMRALGMKDVKLGYFNECIKTGYS